MMYERVMNTNTLKVGDTIVIMSTINDQAEYMLTEGEIDHLIGLRGMPTGVVIKYPVISVLDIHGTLIHRDGTLAHTEYDYKNHPFSLTFRIKNDSD